MSGVSHLIDLTQMLVCLWHLPSNHCRPTGDPLRNACAPCSEVQKHLEHQIIH